MQTVSEIQAGLAHFCGTESWHQAGFLFPNMFYTDGVKYLADKCDAYWLIDAICSHQPEAQKDEMLRYEQYWTLKKEDDKWVLICNRDIGDEAFRQVIGFSDFPLDEIEIWVGPLDETKYTLYLPSER